MSSKMGLLLLGGVGIAYFMYKRNQSVAPSQPGSRPSAYTPSQPSQMYPWLGIVPPRVDNANQPWYNQAKLPAGNGAGAMSQGSDLQAGASIVHSLSDIWGNLSGALSSSESDYSLDTDWLDDGTEYGLTDYYAPDAGGLFDTSENQYSLGVSYDLGGDQYA